MRLCSHDASPDLCKVFGFDFRVHYSLIEGRLYSSCHQDDAYTLEAMYVLIVPLQHPQYTAQNGPLPIELSDGNTVSNQFINGGATASLRLCMY